MTDPQSDMPDAIDADPEVEAAVPVPGSESIEEVDAANPEVAEAALDTGAADLADIAADALDSDSPPAPVADAAPLPDASDVDEPPPADPIYDRLAALSKSSGKSPRDLMAAGGVIHEANGDLSEAEVLNVLEASLAQDGKIAGTVSLVVTHGSYVGPGCTDTAKRLNRAHVGFGYDKSHAAQPGEKIHGLMPADARKLLASKNFAEIK